MFIVDISHIWDKYEITSNFIALVPVRIQPLHNGHVELLLNLSKRFKKVIVLIEPEFGGQDDPFSLEDRIKMVKAVSCHFNLENIIACSILDAKTQPIQARIHWYHELVVDNGGTCESFVVISGNQQVLSSYKNRYKFCFVDWRKVKADKFLDNNFFASRDGNARKIREMIKSGGTISEDLVLPEILKIIKRRFNLKK
ncbi:MAG: adenylyltransferase/cytidyltransferase family protein [bacterium]